MLLSEFVYKIKLSKILALLALYQHLNRHIKFILRVNAIETIVFLKNIINLFS